MTPHRTRQSPHPTSPSAKTSTAMVCMYMYVCMYVCTLEICMYVFMPGDINCVYKNLRVCICMYVCMHVK